MYANNSIIPITEIGQTLEGDEEGGALLCHTDNVQCCSTNSINGRWLLPDQLEVTGMSDTGGFYIDSGPSVVRLHRKNNATSPTTGVFCCEVPDATSANIRTCVNIGELIFMILNCLTAIVLHFMQCLCCPQQ